MITAAYLRISSDTQDVARQRTAIEQWAEREGVAIAQWFEDSEGRNPRDQAAQRVGFQMLLEAVRGGVVKKIIVESQDRFGTRDAYQLGEFLTLLRDNDCELWSVQQGHLTADDDATILTNTIGALTSSREQKEKALRDVGGKREKAALGEYQGGYAPYGCDVACFNGQEKWRVELVGHFERWKITPDGQREAFNGKGNFPAKDANDTLRIVPSRDAKRLAVVKDIFRWYATEDLSPGKIATRLNNMGITTSVGTLWNKVIIKTILINPVYIGFPTWNKRGQGRFKEFIGGHVIDVTNKKVGRPRDKSDHVAPDKPQFEPIIPLELWEQVQAKVESNKQGKKRPAQVDSLWLKSFLFCGKCNKPMRACRPQPRMEYGSYFCGTYGTYGKDNPTECRCHRVKHSIIEAVVDKYLEEIGEGLGELVGCESGLFDAVYSEWAGKQFEKNQLWSKMNATAAPATTLAEVFDVAQRYTPADTPELAAEIEAKESELDDMLGGFYRLSPALQDRANAKMEALQGEIDDLKATVEDLRTPWAEVEREAYQRQEALRYVVGLNDEDGPQRAEALKGVIDKIVCHFRYTKGNRSIIDSVEIHAASADAPALRLITSSGPD